MGEKDNLKCPCCLKRLEITHRDRYESLDEHVSGSKPSLKHGYQCKDIFCVANNLDAAWIKDGDLFFRNIPTGIYHSTAHSIINKFSNDNTYAVNSWGYFYHKGKKNRDKLSFCLNLFFYKFIFIPLEKGSNFPREKQYEPSLLKWKCEIYKRKDKKYVHIIPFWKMINYHVREFNISYYRWTRDYNNKYFLKQCIEIILPDNKRFSVICSKWIIKIFLYKKYKDVIFAYDNLLLYVNVTSHLGIVKKLIDDYNRCS